MRFKTRLTMKSIDRTMASVKAGLVLLRDSDPTVAGIDGYPSEYIASMQLRWSANLHCHSPICLQQCVKLQWCMGSSRDRHDCWNFPLV